MTSQQLADLLLAQWRLLWPLSPAERMERIEEIAKDYEYEEVMAAVKEEIEQ